MAFLSPTAGREDYAALLASPAGFLPSPGLGGGLFASPVPPKGAAVKEGRLSFDVLQLEAEGGPAGPQEAVLEAMGSGGQIKATRSASQIELFTLAGDERPKSADGAASAPAAPEHPQQEQLAALSERVKAKAVAAKQQEAQDMVAGIAAKYGLHADYARAEAAIKAVWAEPAPAARATSAADATAPAKPLSQQHTGGGDSLTLGGRGSSDHAVAEEEAGQQATSALKPHAARAAAAADAAGNALKRPLAPAPTFSFPAAAPAAGGPAASAGDDAAAKKRRVQYDRMRELETEVQQLRILSDALKQSLLQAQAQHTAMTLENDQLWSALTHIHVCVRAAHSANLRQQVALHTAALAAALPPQPMDAPAPSPNTLFGGLFSPADADELAAACGMFVSPAKGGAGGAPTNKPRKLFLEEDAKAGGAARPPIPTDLSPEMWVQVA